MTLPDFKKEINRTYRFEKIWFYFVFTVFSVMWGYVFYDALTNPAKYNKYGTRNLALIGSVCLILFLIWCAFLVPNRYKVLVADSKLPDINKQEVLQKLAEMTGLTPVKREGGIYTFKKCNNWWSLSYTVIICFDEGHFYLSVQSETLFGTYGNGIMDFGGTEKFRKKIKSELEKIASLRPSL